MVEDGKLVGIITESDIFRVMAGLLGGDTEETRQGRGSGRRRPAAATASMDAAGVLTRARGARREKL